MNRELLSRRALCVAAALALCAVGTSAVAQGAAYPDRPVRMVVPFPPGGAIDAMARPVAEAMARELGQAFVLENRAGAAGNIGAAQVAKAAADGYTVLVGTSATHGANPALFKQPGYDAVADFEPVMLWGSVPNVLVVNAAQGPKTLAELTERARRQPDKLSYGSAGTGTSLHLAGVLFEQAAGVKLVHVPYKGGAPASVDLMGGSLDMMFDTVSVSLPNIRGGKLRPLAVAAPERHFALPDVPTFAELGVRGVEAATWAGLFAPKGTPAPVLAQLRRASENALKDARVQEALRTNGVQMLAWPGERFGAFVASETARWGKVVRDAGIPAQ
ncbi:MAG TPA: tripartite tricarboxylate transporter substrate binding protein [Ramlibacter sp.]|nr:tripartite tricarboxylate transporter substrate binding protein [Ramlibacter sp.]